MNHYSSCGVKPIEKELTKNVQRRGRGVTSSTQSDTYQDRRGKLEEVQSDWLQNEGGGST